MTNPSIKEVISISIGSSLRDHSFECNFLEQEFRVRRIGTDGDKRKARELIKKYDGIASAIGLGGIDVFFQVANRTYAHNDGLKLFRTAVKSPIVDGSGLKNTLERWAIAFLHNAHPELLENRRVLVMSGIDRWAMAEVISEFSSNIVFGDFLFNLRFPYLIRNLKSLKKVAAAVLPILCKLPFEWIYPTGRRQETRHERSPLVFKKAEVIAGDFHLIRRYAPMDLSGKTIITNTVTGEDRENLKSRGVQWLITTTPIMDGRTFGANVLEAMFVAHLTSQGYSHNPDVRPSVALRDEYLNLIIDSGVEPSIEQLNFAEETVKNKFTFVVHPLELNDVFKIKSLKWLKNLPPVLVEMALAKLPPVHVSRTSVIRTKSGKETQGSLYALIM
ncbi:MAG: hypothetical protein ABIG42_10935, partial [bacterium]